MKGTRALFSIDRNLIICLLLSSGLMVLVLTGHQDFLNELNDYAYRVANRELMMWISVRLKLVRILFSMVYQD